jgi:hypothetical protein
LLLGVAVQAGNGTVEGQFSAGDGSLEKIVVKTKVYVDAPRDPDQLNTSYLGATQ